MNSYENYLLKIKKEKKLILIFKVSILIFFIVIWEITARINLINTFITSSPYDILITIISLISNGELFSHIAATLYEVTVGFTLGIVLGILTAVILWLCPRAAVITEPYIVVVNALPKVALGPLIIIWAGANTSSIIIMTLAISLVTTIIGVYSGFMQTADEKIILLRSFGSGKLAILKYVVFPSSLANIMSCLKINIGLTWVGAIMGEFLVSKKGIGYLIMYGSQVFNLDLVMSGIVVLAICAGLSYLLITRLEKYVDSIFR